MHDVGKPASKTVTPVRSRVAERLLKFAEVEFANRSQRLGGRAVLKAVRQAIQPGRILYLGFHETGDVVIPALRSAAVIGRTTNADYRCAGCARDAIDLMSVSGPCDPGREVKARALPWTAKGGAPWNQHVGAYSIVLSSPHPMILRPP